uniref:G-protein coupled receptors family 1 profile domain-containing protein n=1 Tax=Monopterus albus TaxID=43700 RepID=A0A3Q3KEE7_MONAL
DKWPLTVIIPNMLCVTVIYIPLMLFGLLGNILTILVVWLRPHMRSSTYLYLSSMAISDLLILLLLPLDLYKLWRPAPWPLGDLACKLTMFLSECCTFCTILHITFLSLERYLAVCWPITAKTMVTRRRTRALIGCLWLAWTFSLPYYDLLLWLPNTDTSVYSTENSVHLICFPLLGNRTGVPKSSKKWFRV